MSDGGKGSRPRPYSVSQREYDTRWDAIFSRDLQEDKPKEFDNTVYNDERLVSKFDKRVMSEEYRVNNLGQSERFREGQWEIDPTKDV